MNWLELATKLARDVPPTANASIAAVLVRGNEIVSVGWNQKKTHPLQARFASNPHKVFLHAEVDAIQKALRRLWRVFTLGDCELYIARVRKDGSVGLAKPCESCQKAIEEFEIKEVRWTDG